MKKSRSAKALIFVAIVLAFVLASLTAWYSAHWLVGHDEVYLSLHHAGFGLISDTAEIINFIGAFPVLMGGLILGLIIAGFFTEANKTEVSRPRSEK